MRYQIVFAPDFARSGAVAGAAAGAFVELPEALRLRRGRMPSIIDRPSSELSDAVCATAVMFALESPELERPPTPRSGCTPSMTESSSFAAGADLGGVSCSAV